MTTKSISTVAAELYALLEPLNPVDRRKVIRSALALLEDEPDTSFDKPTNSSRGDADAAANGDSELHPKVKIWMKQNSLTRDMLDQVFHLDGQMDLIAGDVPGTNGKQKTINAYIITGITSFLRTGEMKFTDKEARDLCRTIGCFSAGNHSSYVNDRGNVFSGGKDGWALTAPGVKAGADLIKQIASS